MTRHVVTPEVRRHIIDLAKTRMSAPAIAKMIGVQANYISQIVSAARRDGEVIPYTLWAYEKRSPHNGINGGLKSVTTKLPQSAVQYFELAAIRNGGTSTRLIGEILVVIAEDNLIAAILDDGTPSP